MPGWLKYLTSASTGFLTVFTAAKTSGLGYGSSTIAGAFSAVTALANLQATSPADHKALGKDN